MSDSTPPRVRILRAVTDIPVGRVSTYGCVGVASGAGPRQVAAVLAHDPGAADVPWHRVVGAGGLLRIPHPVGHAEQRKRLLAEGVLLNERSIRDFASVFLDVSDLR